jgi:hypothetical protein
MMLQINHAKKEYSVKHRWTIFITAVFFILTMSGLSPAETVKQRTFASPEEAVEALVTALRSNDVNALEAIFGPGSRNLIMSGDPVKDQSGREQFLKFYDEKNRLEETADKVFLSVGDDDWPLPIPIVKRDALWRFDAEEGMEELLARRIGRNELSTIQVCLAYVDAQREYAIKDRDTDSLLEYAQKFRSDPGKKNGLYWNVKEGEEQSPLGPLFAEAQEKGYTGKSAAGQAVPYHGYYYRILKGQGRDAPGGAYDYIVNGQMIGGFALVAYPAKYASSGIMTFIANHDGAVYEKDLGDNTEKAALAMKLFNPDSTWKKVEEKVVKGK